MAFLLFLKKIGFFFLDNWRVTVAVIIVLVLAFFIFRSCGSKPEIKIDEDNLQKINSGIEDRRSAEVEKILVENEMVEMSVNQRSEESEKRIKLAEEKVEEARRFDGDVTADELKKILEETR